MLMRVCFAAMALVLAPGLVGAAEPPAVLTASPDGQELLDPASGHAWARCVEGMRWDGRACQGEPALFTLAEALAMARARSETSGKGWRVPRVPEIKLFGDRLAHASQPAMLAPAVNPYAYRNVQRGATESHADRLVPQVGWAVDPRTGEARADMPRRERLPLRLVRNLK
jgi:hypothetical protein